MIITCEECSTKFNLDDTILKQKGTKVRCTICSHIFTAYPLADDAPSQKSTSHGMDGTPPSTTLPLKSEPDLPTSPTLKRETESDSQHPIQPLPKAPPTKPIDELEFEDDMDIDDHDGLMMEDSVAQVSDDAHDSGTTYEDPFPALDVEMNLEDELSVDLAADGVLPSPGEEDPAINFSLEDELTMESPSLDEQGTMDEAELNLDFSMDDDMDFFDDDTDTAAIDVESSEPELDMDFSMDEEMDFSDDDTDTVGGSIGITDSPELDIDISLDEEIPPPQSAESQHIDLQMEDDAQIDFDISLDEEIPSPQSAESQHIDLQMEDDAEIDFDFSLDEEIPPPQSAESQHIDLQMEDDAEIDFDFSLDEEMPPPQSAQSQSLDLQMEEGAEVDFDFSLDEEMPPTQSAQSQSLDLQMEEGAEVDFDFSLDEEMPPPQSAQSQSLDLQMEEGAEVDFDFSLDEEMPPTQSAQSQSLDLQMEEGAEVDFDFSLDEEMPPTQNAQSQSLDLQMEEGAEVDFDFSLDEESPPPQSAQSQSLDLQMEEGTELDLDFSEDDDLDLDFSIDEPSTDNQGLNLEDGDDVDLDFSFDAPPTSEFSQDMEETLELELEDDAELYPDFPIMDDASKRAKTDGKKGDTLNLESSTAMDLDFSMEESLSEEDDPFAASDADEFETAPSPLYEEELDSDELMMESGTPMSESVPEETPLKEPSSPDKATLSEERPHLFYENNGIENKKSFGPTKLIVMILFLFIVTIAGYAAAIMTGVEIPYVSDIKIPYFDKYIPRPAPEPVKLTPLKKSITTQFLVNSTSGTLFVIRGEVLNQSKVPCKNVKLQGTLITNEKKSAKTSSMLCGNMIPEERLKTMDISAINALLSKRETHNRFTVEPGKTIPFLLVFSDFPDSLETFTVTVTDFERLPQKK